MYGLDNMTADYVTAFYAKPPNGSEYYAIAVPEGVYLVHTEYSANGYVSFREGTSYVPNPSFIVLNIGTLYYDPPANPSWYQLMEFTSTDKAQYEAVSQYTVPKQIASRRTDMGQSVGETVRKLYQ